MHSGVLYAQLQHTIDIHEPRKRETNCVLKFHYLTPLKLKDLFQTARKGWILLFLAIFISNFIGQQFWTKTRGYVSSDWATWNSYVLHKGCITQSEIDIYLWESMTNYFEIEIVYFMTDSSYKCTVNNTNIKIQKGVMFVTVGATFQ